MVIAWLQSLKVLGSSLGTHYMWVFNLWRIMSLGFALRSALVCPLSSVCPFEYPSWRCHAPRLDSMSLVYVSCDAQERRSQRQGTRASVATWCTNAVANWNRRRAQPNVDASSVVMPRWRGPRPDDAARVARRPINLMPLRAQQRPASSLTRPASLRAGPRCSMPLRLLFSFYKFLAIILHNDHPILHHFYLDFHTNKLRNT